MKVATRLVCVALTLAAFGTIEIAGPATAYTPRGPILIQADADFTAANGVTGGSGSMGEPFLLEAWDITGSGPGGWGIEIRATSAFFTIRGVRVSGAGGLGAIAIIGSGNARVESSDLQGGTALWLDSVTNGDAVNNAVFGDISVSYSFDVTVSGSSGTGAITVFDTDGFTISGNTVSSIGLWGASRNGRVSSNALGPDGIGVGITSRSDVGTIVIDADNTTAGAPVVAYSGCNDVTLGQSAAAQLILMGCSHVTVVGFKGIQGVLSTVQLHFVDNSTISASRVYAISARESTDITVVGNEFVYLSIYNGQELYIADNRADQINVEGAGLAGGTHVNAWVTGNELESFYTSGFDRVTVLGNRLVNGSIYSRGSRDLTIADNTVVDSVGAAIYLWDCYRCTVFHNNVLNASMNMFDNWPSGNFWDDGYPSGGNFWSDYAGIDDCSGPGQNVCPDPDGIGDTPLPVFGGVSVDRFPLMQPRDAPPKAYLVVTPTIGTTDSTFVGDASASWDVLTGRGGLEARWDWEDDSTWDTGWSQDLVVSHQYASTGVFTVRVAVRDSGGLESSTVKQVTVLNRPPVAALTVSPTSGNVTTTFTADASASTDPEDSPGVLEVRWDWEGDGTWDTPWSTTKIATHSYSSVGLHTMAVQVRDREGLAANASSTVRVENTGPNAAFTLSPERGSVATVFAVDAAASSDRETPATDLRVRWDWEDDGVWDTEWTISKSAEHRYDSPGVYAIRMEVRDGHNATASTVRSVSVAALSDRPSSSGIPVFPLVLVIVLAVVVLAVAYLALRRRPPPSETRERTSK